MNASACVITSETRQGCGQPQLAQRASRGVNGTSGRQHATIAVLSPKPASYATDFYRNFLATLDKQQSHKQGNGFRVAGFRV